MSCLQQLCSLLPFNPWHWYNLGQTCLQLLESDRTTGRMEFISLLKSQICRKIAMMNECSFSVSPFFPWCDLLCSPLSGSCSPQRCVSPEEKNDGDAEEKQEEAAELEENRIWLKACTCFIRTRYCLVIAISMLHIYYMSHKHSTQNPIFVTYSSWKSLERAVGADVV